MKNEEKKEIRYFSMFTGVGGFELGFEQSNKSGQQESIGKGAEWTNNKRQRSISNTDDRREQSEQKKGCGLQFWKCIGFSEIDKYANELLKKRFPEVKNYGDATKIKPSELPNFDLLCAGFPCQAFSIAGKRGGFQDTRGTLFFEIARIVEAKRPKLVLLENVKGLLNHEKGKTFSVILQTLSELGYDVQWMVLNSKFFGVPQNRERVFIIGSIRGEPRPEILPFRESNKILNKSEEEGQVKSESTAITKNYSKGVHSGGETYLIHNVYGGFKEKKMRQFIENSPTIRTPKGGGHLPMVVASRGRNPENPSDRTTGSPTEQRLELNKEGTTNTLSSIQKDNMVLEEMKIRRLTPIECERLQGFPDGWTEGFSDTQRYKMMGNAVTTKVVEAIANKISSQ
jgi:DNA (cytosine-5)-methyltransferase 1